MKVDVYPNINNVEVYENPISVPVEASWEKVIFTVPDPVVLTFVLPSAPVVDQDGDYVLKVFFNTILAEYGVDYTLSDKTITWLNVIALEAGETLEAWYSPKSAYGSVPGSGEVTALNHLSDVTITAALDGELLIRNASGKFVNKSLVAGSGVSISKNDAVVTVSATPTQRKMIYDNTKGSGDFVGALNTHYYVDTSTAVNDVIVTLPVSSDAGSEIRVKVKDSTQNVIIQPTAGQYIDSVLNNQITLSNANEVKTLMDNGTDGWELV